MIAVQDLVLLGLLMDRPLHGYEIKQIVEEQMSQVAKISPGTIYYTLKKLEKQGLIVQQTQEREGNRPERQVYTITSEGELVFRNLLRDSLLVDERPYFCFDAGFYFFKHIDPSDLEEAIGRKLEHARQFRRRLEQLEDNHPGKWPFHLEALKKKGFLYTEALEAWFNDLREGLEARRKKQETTNPPTSEVAV